MEISTPCRHGSCTERATTLSTGMFHPDIHREFLLKTGWTARTVDGRERWYCPDHRQENTE